MVWILETERLYLRQFKLDDAASLYKLNANPKVIRYTGDKPFANADEAKHFLENYHDYALYNCGRWGVITKNGNEFIGWCGLKYDAAKGETDIGFRLFEECWGNGYATESAAACLHYGFHNLKLQSVVGRAMVRNVASIAVLQKIGMRFYKMYDFDGDDGVVYKAYAGAEL